MPKYGVFVCDKHHRIIEWYDKLTSDVFRTFQIQHNLECLESDLVNSLNFCEPTFVTVYCCRNSHGAPTRTAIKAVANNQGVATIDMRKLLGMEYSEKIQGITVRTADTSLLSSQFSRSALNISYNIIIYVVTNSFPIDIDVKTITGRLISSYVKLPTLANLFAVTA
ncbi:hypothetical protein ABLA30_14215 [Xenorhabdus nematophila]|uniref:hypothetical protein n=1 Tax=Xenorhabdus nematophila TaxID=628 RepID=UPI0032B747AD